MRLSFWVTVFVISPLFGPALKAQYIEIGGSLGGVTYSGDLSPRINPEFFKPGGQAFLRHNISPVFVVRYNFLYGTLTATDLSGIDSYQTEFRQLGFSQNIYEGSVLMEYNFFDYRNMRLKYKRDISPYLFGGFGMMKMNPQISPEGRRIPGGQPVVPFGFGVKYARPTGWNFGLELGARKTFTDHLDGVGDIETSLDTQLGIPDSKDWYYHAGFVVSYTFLGVNCKTPFYY